MKGYIEKRGKGYTIRLDLGTDLVTGKRTQKRISGFRTKREATAKLNELIAADVQGEFVEPHSLTVAEYMRSWLQSHKVNVAFTSHRTYTTHVEIHIIPWLGHVPLQKLHQTHIQDFLDGLHVRGRVKNDSRGSSEGLSPQTVRAIFRTLNMALSRAAELRLIPRNPAEGVRPPPPRGNEPVMLPPDDVQKLVAGFTGHPLYLPVFIAVHTGMRLGEIIGLAWDSVDLEQGVVFVRRVLPKQLKSDGMIFKKPKTKSSIRAISITQEAVNVLREAKVVQEELKQAHAEIWTDYNLVCCTEDGHPLCHSYVSYTFANVARTLGYELTFHQLRDVFVGLLIQADVHIKTISAILGHSSSVTTLDRYGGLIPAMQQDAVKRVDGLLQHKVVGSCDHIGLELEPHEAHLVVRALVDFADAQAAAGPFVCADGSVVSAQEIWQLAHTINARYQAKIP